MWVHSDSCGCISGESEATKMLSVVWKNVLQKFNLSIDIHYIGMAMAIPLCDQKWKGQKVKWNSTLITDYSQYLLTVVNGFDFWHWWYMIDKPEFGINNGNNLMLTSQSWHECKQP